jgi:hypothetical protein
MTHKHNFKPAEDFVQYIGDRVTRIQREQCDICGGFWNNPIHMDAAIQNQSVDGYYGTNLEIAREPVIYDDKLPKIYDIAQNDTE